MAQGLTIGQVAKITGLAAKTIRYYEHVGILPVTRRTASGYRQYDAVAVERVRFIRRARSLGLPLRRLKTLTNTFNVESRSALGPGLLALIQEQLSAVRQRILELELQWQQLEQVSRRIQALPARRGRGSCECLDRVNGTSHATPSLDVARLRQQARELRS